MRIKLDENIPSRPASIRKNLGHDTNTVPQEKLIGRDDTQIWEAAQNTKRFLITQDLDFSDIRQFVPGTHYGLLLVPLHDPGRDALVKRIENVFQTEDVDNWKGCFAVVTDLKIRVQCSEEGVFPEK